MPCILPSPLRGKKRGSSHDKCLGTWTEGLWGSVCFGGPWPRIWVSRDAYPRDRCPVRALREAAPPRRSAASAHVTAQSRSDAFSAAGCSASLVALAAAAGRRESSGRTGGGRGPGAPRWNRKWRGVAWAWLPGARSWGAGVPGSCASRSCGRARVSAGTRGEGWSMAAPRPESVGEPGLSHPPAGAGPPPHQPRSESPAAPDARLGGVW